MFVLSSRSLLLFLVFSSAQLFAQSVSFSELVTIMRSDNPARILKSRQSQTRLSAWNAEIANKVTQLSEKELNRVVKGEHSPELNRKRFTKVSPEHRALNLLFLLEPSPVNQKWIFETALEWASNNRNATRQFDYNALVNSQNVEKPLHREVDQILKSVVLDWQNQRELLLRSVLRRHPESQRRALLRGIDPRYRGGAKEQAILSSASGLRQGFFTGVFNPFHPGHNGVVEFAVAQNVLDKIVVIPTPATTHNELPEDWSHRKVMAEFGTEKIPEAEVIGKDYLESLSKNTGEGIRKLMIDRGQGHTWFQIMGADSFERFVERGFVYDLGKKGRAHHVFVVYRPGYPVPEIPSLVKSRVSLFNPIQDLPNYPEEARSSSQIRKRLLAGQSISGLVTKKIEQYILKHKLYTSETPQNAQFIALKGCHEIDHRSLSFTHP